LSIPERCTLKYLNSEVTTKELPPAVQELHEQSIIQERDVLSTADEKDTRWLAKDGTDCSGAFGKDLAQYMDDEN